MLEPVTKKCECLQQDKAAAEAYEQETTLRELATASERNIESAAAVTLEEATLHDAGPRGLGKAQP